MATDDSEPRDEGSRRGPRNFVDRDDDEGSAGVDFDYDDDFPPGDTEEDEEGPDPGYAAFASELEDPLADWPAPDARLEDLPEIQRHAQGRAPSAVGGDGGPVPIPGVSAERFNTAEESGAEDFPEAPFFDDPADENTDGNPDENEGPLFSDRDEDDLEPFFANPQDEDRDAVGATWLNPEPDRADRDDGMAPDSDEDEDEDEDEDFVDDFLADLDAHDEEPRPESTPTPAEPRTKAIADPLVPGEPSSAADADIAGAAVASAATLDRPQPREGHEDGKPAERSLSPGMIIVVLAALGLLAAGGYGVISQRSSLESEIRELQAQLATAMGPEEAAAEREQQRQIELANESLEARLETLQVENAALEARVSELEEELAGRPAGPGAADSGVAAPAPAPVEQSKATAGSTGQQRPADTGTSSTGPWFVNFGSFGERDVAERWAGQLSVGDGRVVIQEASAAGKTVYRVRVVALGSKDSAERLARNLEQQYELPRLWVGRN